MDAFLLSWFLAPVLLCALSLGCGMLVAWAAERTGTPRGDAFPGVLVVPIGFALVVLIASLVTNWEATAPLAAVAPVVVAVIGFVVGRHRLAGWWAGRRSIVWPFVAGLLPFGSVAAPVFFTGKVGVSGFTKITDLGHQLAFIEYLRTDGRAPIGQTTSSFDEIIKKLVDGYPGGTQSVVASMGDLVHTNITWVYQPVLAFVAAMLGVALYAVMRRAIPSRPWRAVAAGVAAQPTILYAYTLAAGIKEISSAAAIVLVAAVLAERRPLGWSPLVPAAIAFACAFAIFSVTVLPWIGILFVVFLAFELVGEPAARKGTALRWGAIAVLGAIFTAQSIGPGLEILKATGSTGPVGLGNLAAPVPGWSTFGPWITADHRFPLDRYGSPDATYILIGVAIVLIAFGLRRAVVLRDRGMIALALAGAVAVGYILWKSEVWVQLKAFCITAPIALALAFSGAADLAALARGVRLRRALAIVGVAAAAAVGIGVLYGNALQYHHTPMATPERVTELMDISKRFEGQGPALLPDFDEFADYTTREVRGSGLVDPWRGLMTYNRTATPGLQTVRDTDEYDQRFLQTFPLIIRRRDPVISRPPSNFQLAETTRDYEVWKRVGDPREIAAHYPLKNKPKERTARFCARVQDSVDKVGDGARIRYAIPAPDVTAVIADPKVVPPGWGFDPKSGDIHTGTPGRLQQGFAIKNPGTYRVYIRGSIGRRVKISIDGKVVGTPRWRESYPGHYEVLQPVTLRGRDHTLTIFRGGGNVLPGTGNDASGATTTLGPLVLEPTSEREVMRTAPASRLRSVCRSSTRMDWIEVLRPAAR